MLSGPTLQEPRPPAKPDHRTVPHDASADKSDGTSHGPDGPKVDVGGPIIGIDGRAVKRAGQRHFFLGRTVDIDSPTDFFLSKNAENTGK